MREAAVVLDRYDVPIFWHVPEGCGIAAIPDSRTLWDVLKEFRDCVQAVAHTHPGCGRPRPSSEDLSTFRAVESALGKRLVWHILTSDSFLSCVYSPDHDRYASLTSVEHLVLGPWVHHLRRLSEYGA